MKLAVRTMNATVDHSLKVGLDLSKPDSDTSIICQ